MKVRVLFQVTVQGEAILDADDQHIDLLGVKVDRLPSNHAIYGVEDGVLPVMSAQTSKFAALTSTTAALEMARQALLKMSEDEGLVRDMELNVATPDGGAKA